MKQVFLFIFILTSIQGLSQNFNMPSGNNGGPGTLFITCSGAFNDNGGPANYGNNQNGLATFCPGIDTDRMELNFLQMSILSGDVLTVYDGDNTTAAVIGTYTNTTTAPGLLRASAGNPTGCLTVRFVSNGSQTSEGWRAAIGCFNPCQAISPVISTTPTTDPDGVLRVCQGTSVVFNGSANFSVDGTGATYQWDLGNGRGRLTGQSQTETYNTGGIYLIKFTVTDNTGCVDRDDIDLVVHVSTTPDFAGTQAARNTLCFGESTTIAGIANATEFTVSPSPPVAGTTFLPDGSGLSFETCIDVDLFPTGQTVTSASDILNIFLNMEHSYMGDLGITITAPNGATVSLHNFSGGGGTFLGNPIDDDSNLNPGTGFDYVFTETATRTWLQAAPGAGVSLPAGNYRPVDPFSRFVGAPLNGRWCIRITDNLSSDNGFIFFWGINFNPAIIPPDFSFTPGAVSRRWVPAPGIIATNNNLITVQPATAGPHCYDYEFVDDFGCTYTRQVCINVQPEISSAAPNDIIICDTTNTTTTIDLTANNNTVYNGLSTANYTLTYHLTATAANAGTGAIANPASYTPASNPQTVYSRIRDNATNCAIVDDFVIFIGTPSYNTVPDLVECDMLPNDGRAIFDLESQIMGILNGQSATTNAVTFYENAANAIAGAGAITNPDTYTNTAPTQTIYVRIENTTDTTCFSTGDFDLVVNETPVATQPSNIIVCDDISNDGLATFVLSNQDAAILNGQSDVVFQVTYHDSQANANTGTGPLDDFNYTNTLPTEIIYARVVNRNNDDCIATTNFTIQVDVTALANTVADLVLIDDVTNDGVEFFDLTTQYNQILGNQDPSVFVVTYHTTATGAALNTDLITNPGVYANTSNPQTIYIRVANVNNSDCVATGNFELIVSALPIPGSGTSDIIVCDDPSNDGAAVFVLSNQDASIYNGQSDTVFNITYHISQADANAGTGAISRTSYTNTTRVQTIYARIFNVSNPDAYDTTSFIIQVDQTAVYNSVTNLTQCDDVTNDGIETFDLTTQTVDILGSQDPAMYRVTYHTNFIDASTGNAPIANPTAFANTSNPQTIHVRVFNIMNTACAATGEFTINVSQLPIANATTAIALCDDSSNDGTANFELTPAIAQVLGVQNPASFSVTFHNSQSDADARRAAVGTNFRTGTTTLIARIENNLNNTCYNTTTLSLLLNVLPQPALLDGYIICKDPAGVLLNGPAILDSGLDNATYDFIWTRDTAVIAGATNAIYNAVDPGIYEVTAINRMTGCENTAFTTVRQSGVPQVYDVQVTTNPFNFSHGVIATASGPDFYWFRLDDGPYEDNGVFDNVAPGPHTVTVAERNGCGEIVIDIFVYGYPDYFTPNNDGYHDTWNILGGDRLPGTTLYVFDRFGKLLKQLDPAGTGWDGTFNGQLLPSSDYWFTIEYEFNNVKRIAKGHFALKR